MSFLKRYAVSNARKASFKKLTDSDVRTLSGIVGGGSNVLRASPEAAKEGSFDPLEPYSKDWLKQVQGDPPLVLFPHSTEEVSALLKYCNKERIAVTPQSGNTGLVFASVPVHDEIVISMSKMTTPMKIHEETFSATLGAGVVLQSIQDEAAKHGLLFPLDMGSKGSAQVGGFVSTNAGGIYYARYGSVRSNVLALEAVTATGEVLTTMNRSVNGERQAVRAVRKDNVGYDLKQLFVGSEGTLGLVTEAEFQLHPAPSSRSVLLLHLRTFQDVVALYRLCKNFLGDGLLSAFEVMDSSGVNLAYLRGPTPPGFPLSGFAEANMVQSSFAVLVEAQGSNQAADEQRVMQLVSIVNGEMNDAADASGSSAGELEDLVRRCGFRQQSALIDQVMAADESQRALMFSLREGLPIKLSTHGTVVKFDVCFPLDTFYSPVLFARRQAVQDLLGLNLDDVIKQGAASPDLAKVEALLHDEIIITGYGHFGDGNCHLNIVDVTKDQRQRDYIMKTLASKCYKDCAARGGSISAEHGIGLQKKPYLHLCRSDAYFKVMEKLKEYYDPNGILNPYKVL